MNAVLDLRHTGPTEQEWAAVCSRMQSFAWPEFDRLVVVSPHPDDETFGVGGLMAQAADIVPVTVIAVTDGEAAWPEASPAQRRAVATLRRSEAAAAHRALALDDAIERMEFGYPDGAVTAKEATLRRRLGGVLRSADLVVCPLADDGHPDHESSARATIAACRSVGATVWGYPVWAWQCHEPARTPLIDARRVDLPADALQRKLAAIACYQSQTAGDDPVVPPRMIARLTRPFEVLLPLGVAT